MRAIRTIGLIWTVLCGAVWLVTIPASGAAFVAHLVFWLAIWCVLAVPLAIAAVIFRRDG